MQNQPSPYDAVYSEPSVSLHDGVVLGGLEGVRQQLKAPDEAVRVAALKKAHEYGDAGLDLLIDVLKDLQKLTWETEEGKEFLCAVESIKGLREISAWAKTLIEILEDDSEKLSQQASADMTAMQRMLADW